MKKEITKGYYVRLYKEQRDIIRKMGKKLKVSDAEALRQLIEKGDAYLSLVSLATSKTTLE